MGEVVVVEFELNGKVFTLNKSDGKYYSEDGKWANYIEILDKSRVIKVKDKIEKEAKELNKSVSAYVGMKLSL